MEQETGRLFWVSYADLMTALFIIALVLFVLSHKSFKITENDLAEQHTTLVSQQIAYDQENKGLKAKVDELQGIQDRSNAYKEQKQQLASAYQQLESLQGISSDYSKQGEELEKVRNDLALKERIARRLIQQLNSDRHRLAVMEEEYKKLREIQKALEKLDPRYFEYQAYYKRYMLKAKVLFPVGENEIARQYRNSLIVAGRALQGLIKELEPDDNIKYLLVIEGMASRDDYDRNYELSYERALALYELWQEAGIHFNTNRIEVMISGSGEGGVGRDRRNETNNQRFLIQIIPKIGPLRAFD